MVIGWILDEIINKNKQIAEQYIQYDLNLYFKTVNICTEKYLEVMQYSANNSDSWVMKMWVYSPPFPQCTFTASIIIKGYVYFLKKERKERGKETKKEKDSKKDRKERKKWASNNWTQYSLPLPRYAGKILKPGLFPQNKPGNIDSYPGNWKETRFALNYQNMCPNLLFIWSVQIFLLSLTAFLYRKIFIGKCNSLLSFPEDCVGEAVTNLWPISLRNEQINQPINGKLSKVITLVP